MSDGHVWADIDAMMLDVWRERRESGQEVDVFDAPHLYLIGYKCGERVWRVHLRAIQDYDGPNRPLYVELLRTIATRKKLGNLGAFPG